MKREEIQKKIHQGVRAHLDAESQVQVTDESRFERDLEIDSMEIIELLFDVEDAFKVSISDEAARGFETVGDVVDYIFENQADKAS